jgi:hypothetical protein
MLLPLPTVYGQPTRSFFTVFFHVDQSGNINCTSIIMLFCLSALHSFSLDTQHSLLDTRYCNRPKVPKTLGHQRLCCDAVLGYPST